MGNKVIMKREKPSGNHLIRVMVICALLVVLAVLPFDTLWASGGTICIHFHLLGFQCPLCGMTRAVHQVLHFRFVSAFHYNVVVFLLPLYLAIDVATLFYNSARMVLLKKIIVIVIAFAFLSLYAFRMAIYFNWI